MDLEMKVVPTEVEGFKPGEIAKLKYDTKQVVSFLKESDNKAEALDWLEKISTYDTADIAVMCSICKEYTPMNSLDGRARGVFICDKCRNAIMHVRNILENGGSVT